MRLIPHRPPFLFVDDVVEVCADRITTAFRADPGLPFFAGHFPGRPIMPGVLLCECCLQAGAVLMQYRNASAAPPHGGGAALRITGPVDREAASAPAGDPMVGAIPVVTRILEAKFKRPVHPGDALVVNVDLDEGLGGAYFMSGRITAAGETAVRCRFAVALSPRE